VPALRFTGHTYLREGEIPAEQLLRVERRKIRFLARQLLDDLHAGEKIFVYQPRDEHGGGDMERLAEALAPTSATLLWVTAADAANPPGRVERVGAGLLRGYANLAPTDMVHAPDLDSWLMVCRNAVALMPRRGSTRALVRLGFGIATAAPDCMLDGWSHPEEEHTWMIGASSTLLLPRPAAPEALLHLSVIPFVHAPELPAQALRLVANDHEIGAWRVSGPVELNCVIPRAALAAADTLRLVFHHPDAMAPARFPDCNGDTRVLAIMTRGLEIHAL